MTTLLLVSILAATAIANWPGPVLSLEGQASQLVSDIRYTQAISMNQEQRYRINFASDRYWLSNQDGTVTIDLPANGQSEVLMEPGIALTTSQGFVVFGKDGTPYSDAATPGTPLAADDVITLSSGATSKTVTISPETGRVLLQ